MVNHDVRLNASLITADFVDVKLSIIDGAAAGQEKLFLASPSSAQKHFSPRESAPRAYEK